MPKIFDNINKYLLPALQRNFYRFAASSIPTQLRTDLGGLAVDICGLTEAEFKYALNIFSLVNEEIEGIALRGYGRLEGAI